MPSSMSEQELVFSKANLALEKSRRLLESWLPSVSKSAEQPKTEAELEQEEAEIFQATPDLLGLGATPAADVEDGDFRRHELTSNEKLRQQMLGRDYKKYGFKDQAKSGKSLPAVMGSKPKSAPTKKVAVQEDSEEEGRSGLGASKKRKKTELPGSEEKSASGEEQNAKTSRSTKRASNYLDEVLQAKANKKKRKKTKIKAEPA